MKNPQKAEWRRETSILYAHLVRGSIFQLAVLNGPCAGRLNLVIFNQDVGAPLELEGLLPPAPEIIVVNDFVAVSYTHLLEPLAVRHPVRLNELFAAFDQTGRNIYHSGNDTVLRQDVEITVKNSAFLPDGRPAPAA